MSGQDYLIKELESENSKLKKINKIADEMISKLQKIVDLQDKRIQSAMTFGRN